MSDFPEMMKRSDCPNSDKTEQVIIMHIGTDWSRGPQPTNLPVDPGQRLNETFEKFSALSVSVEPYLHRDTNTFWQKIDVSTYAPRSTAITHCGLLFRGDTRPPETIFEHGFKPKGNSHILNEENFIDEILKARLKKTSLGNGFNTLTVDRTSAVCCSREINAAACFPSLVKDEETYVYGCFVNAGIQVFDTLKNIEEPLLTTHATQSIKETVTSFIPPEHVICAWKVSRSIIQTCPPFQYRFQHHPRIENSHIDHCVAACLSQTPLPPEDSRLKIATLYPLGVIGIETAQPDSISYTSIQSNNTLAD